MYLKLKLAERLATEILYTVCKPGSLDGTQRTIGGHNWILRTMSKVFKVGLLLPRLDLNYAVQNHYLSNILEAEDLLMKQYPDQTRKQRDEFRYALCAAETWPCRDVFLEDIEPIFPQRKPPVDNTSPLSDALSAAAYLGHIDLVQKLLDEGADQNFDAGYLKPALHQAASRGHNDILLLLLREGADIDLGYWMPRTSECGALSLANLYGHERTVELLRNRGDDLKMGRLSFTNVRFPGMKEGHLDLREVYMEPEMPTRIKNEPNWAFSKLQAAIYNDHEHVVRWLLQNGLDVTKNNRQYWNKERPPLEIAALHGRLPIVRLLLEHDVKRSDAALACAAQNGHVEVAKLLLDTAGEDVDIRAMLHGRRPFLFRSRARRHDTPLRLAVCNGEVAMVRFLLDRGIERDFHELEAVRGGDEEILRLLLEAKVRLGIEKDYTGLLRRERNIPKRISDLILELSPVTRARAAESGKEAIVMLER